MKKVVGLVAVLVVLAGVGCNRTCEPACFNNGTCNNGVCDCTEGHWGAVCERDSCITCLNRYVDIYEEEYFDNLDTLSGFCEDCVTQWMVDSARTRAERKSLQLNCLDLTKPASSINLSQILRDRQFVPVSDSFTQDDKDDIIKLNSWLDFNPIASPGYIDLPICK